MYIIDAIIRNTKSLGGENDKEEKKRNSIAHIKDIYRKRFAINICKTFTNLFNQANKNERVAKTLM